MATAAKHDVPLTLTVETVGLESIKKLKADVAALGKQGADAVPEFAKLGAEIERLADQAALVTTFGRLADEVEALSVAQVKTSQASKALSGDLAEQTAVTNTLRASEIEAKKALELAQQGLFEKKQALAALKNGTSDYTAEARIQTAEIIKSRGEIRELSKEYKVAKVATAEAAAGERDLATQLKASSSISNAASKALGERSAALNSTKDALDAAGLATTDFAAAEAALTTAHSKLITEVTAVGQALATTKASTLEMAEADRLLAIEQKGLAALFEKGRVALIAEVTAFQEAARSSRAYTDARDAENTARAKADDLWKKEAFAIVENAEARQRNYQETKRLIEAQNFLIAQDAADKWQREAVALVNATEAAQKLRRETQLLAEAEQSLANDAAIAASALGKIDNAAKEAGDGIANALGAVGVRSAAAIKIEIDKVRSAMDLLKSSGTLIGPELQSAFAKGSVKIKELERDLREANGQMTIADKAARLFSGSLAQISAGNLIADGIGYLSNKVRELSVEFFTVNLESQRLTKALTQTYGDSAKAAEQFNFLRETTNRAGVSIRDVSDGFLRFSAATQSSGIALEQSNAVFGQVTKAAGFLGLRGEQVTGVLEALGQMASKGTVSLEELRGQLGDRLPGALGIAAKGMNMTQGELIKMIESGALATNVFFPAFTRGLEETFGAGEVKIEGFIQGWNRLINAIVETAQKASDTSLFTAMGKAFDFVAVNIDSVVKGLEVLAGRFAAIKVIDIATSFFSLGSAANKASVEIAKKSAAMGVDTAATAANTVVTSANTVAKTQNAAVLATFGAELLATSAKTNVATASVVQATVATGALSVAKTAAVGAFNLMAGAARGLTAALGGPVGLVVTLAVFGKDIGESVAKMMGWGKVLEENEKKIEAHAAVEKKVHDERVRQALDQSLASAAASRDAVQARKDAELAVISADKDVKAKEQKLKATQDLVNLQGQEIAGMVALVAASQDVVTASKGELDAKQQLVNKATEEIEAIRKTVDERGKLTKAQEEEITKRQILIDAMKSEVEQQAEVVRGLTVELASRKVAAEALKDNSMRVDELALAYTNAADKVEVLRASGVASMQQISTAEIEAAAAMKIFKGAVDDAVAAISLKGRTEVAALNTTLASTAASKSNYEALAKGAEVLGDYTMKVYYQIEAKKAERSGVEASIKIKQIEIEMERDQIKVQMDAIKSTDAVSVAKRAELVIQLENIKAKEIALGVSKSAIKALDDEIAGLINGTSARKDSTLALNNDSDARGSNTRRILDGVSALEAENAAIIRKNTALETSIALENKRRGVDSSGFSADKSGKRIDMGSDIGTATGIMKFLQSAGVDNEGVAKRLTSEFLDSNNNVVYAENAGQKKYGGDTLSMALLKAAETYTFGGGKELATKATGAGTGSTSAAGSTNTVNITIGGVLTPINVTSASDASNLQSVLNQLAAAQGRSI